MSDERRRYFRITERVGVAYELLGADGESHGRVPDQQQEQVASLLDDIEALDGQILHELEVMSGTNPQIARLVSLFNQKLERVVNHVLMDNQLVSKLAQKLQEVNISACGMGFFSDEAAAEGALLRLELTLYPDKKTLNTHGKVIACELEAGSGRYYWRVDFESMSKVHQELLIQHIVRSQSQQLKNKLKY
ncbi:PilZ domain-containing protein [Teredinibacter turnerae]|uniref:PilZ domain-containing protein n=1 Tax=Teredinibacter turnerae (strain ATCC 39867 / T7901) TaxID=377629 RepID=C5BPT4_TERTT|nr:PilZ domain-containing protein [Teredinibacter turnerae]ACR14431.1 hypothetical protein TERTU_3189 [Teredinibacter turnerae T7901]